MVKWLKLDKVFVQGTTYTMPPDMFYVIKKLGCDQDTATKLVIDGVETGAIIQKLANMYPTSTNELGPLDLKNLFYVVPPDKKFWVSGASGAKMRCIGLIGKLMPGEEMPTEYLTRFDEQGKHYYTYDELSKLYSADYTWSAGEEIEIGSLTPKTTERYVLNSIIEVETGVSGLSPGDVGLVLILEGEILDILTTTPGKKGLDVFFMPRPPAYNTVNVPFSFEDLPIEVPGDYTLTMKLINNSGGNLTVAAATDQYIDYIVEYQKIK